MVWIHQKRLTLHFVAYIGLSLAMLCTVAHADNQAALKHAIANTHVVTDIKSTTEQPDAKDWLAEDFKKLDHNQDQKISIKEAVKDKALAMGFDSVDINQDGVISNDEYVYFKATSITDDRAMPMIE